MTGRGEVKENAAKAPGDVDPIEAHEIAGSAAPAHDAAESTASRLPIVGIGASAGGLAAFEAFFSGMPADTDPGMAFVLVQHLAPDHKSILTDIIRRYTRMQVFEVEDGMEVKPNCTYIIPPNHDMAFLNGALQLLEPSAPRGQRLPIDFFFRSLAQDQRERAIGIVLSGTGSDGTLGVWDIKGEGGMVMAQNPASTEYDGMPRNAIATGLVDYELPPAEMPAQLIAYVSHAFGNPPRVASAPTPKTESALKKIFVLLRAQTGHDFSQYKPSTIHRRIERRMAVQQIETMDGYVQYMQRTSAEVDALFRDLLIGVTSFFRDPPAFHAIEEQVIPKLFEGKPAGALVRVWSAGCSTGEEAYSIAILLQERLETLKQSYKVQVFATDIDRQAIAAARAGLYPASIAADISPERLARFFAAESDGSAYRIHKSIRDMLVFSEQDVIKDPPFSKLDLISCRNLMIYMGGKLQKKLISLFHYALNPDGMLFLGISETVGEPCDLFGVLDRNLKFYQRKEDLHGPQRAVLGRFLEPTTAIDVALIRAAGKPASPLKRPLRELTEQTLLQQVVPAGALVNSQGDMLYLHGSTGMYLEPAPGEAGINNILKMAREGLRRELTMALNKAVGTREVVRRPGLRVKTNVDFVTVNLTVCPVAAGPAATPEAPLFLVAMEEAPPSDVVSSDQPSDTDADVAVLKQELRAKEEYLQTANEELETANEELNSSNEEMQSVNEELQSTNEELETAKEEMQSVNEELATINTELQTKVTDLSRVNNDMNNLLAGTGIGTIFVDHQLRILRFTPTVTRIINLIPSDVGRPVSHIVSNLVGYDGLVADTQAVLDTLLPKEVDVQTTEGKWYTMRILPYRTLDNQIEGAVITFVDVTEMKRVEEALKRTADVLSQSNEDVRQFAYIVSHDLRTPLVNFRGFVLELRRSLADLDLLVQPAVEALGETERAIVDRIFHEDFPNAMGFIDSSVVRMDHLINSLLRLSRLGRHELVPERLDLGRLVSTILASLDKQIEACGATVTVLPLPEVTTDRISIEQILNNILSNAVLYLDPARPGRIEVAGRVDAAELVMHISDNGRGIADDDREKVFAPFRRAGAPDVPGEGMGLAYVQALIRRQEGRIWFDSQPGVGTTFSFVLPIVRS